MIAWFGRRGIYYGWVIVAVMFVTLFISPGVAALSAELILRIGWRETMWWFGIAAMVVLIPINLLFHRHSAERIGLVPDGPSTRPATRTAPVKAGATIGDAVRTPAFWLLSLAVTMTGVCTMTTSHGSNLIAQANYG
jgi:MFS family permease